MTEKIDYFYLQRLILEFEKLDARLFEELKNSNFDFIGNVRDAKLKIKKYISDRDTVEAKDFLAVKIKKIRDNYGYNIDTIWSKLEEISGERIHQEHEEVDFVSALFEEGTADYVDDNHFRRKNQVGTLVCHGLPQKITDHLNRLKECYSLGLFYASTVYCRALIEAGGYAYLCRKRPENTCNQEEYSLKSLMVSLKPFTDKFVHTEADKVVKKANDLLHFKKSQVKIDEKEAFSHIQSTFAFIENLYK